MGCAPSQSSLIQNFSKNGPGSFRKGRMLRAQLERIESLTETQSKDGGGITNPCEMDTVALDRGGGIPHPPRQCQPILPEIATLKPGRKSSLPEEANSLSICPEKIGMQEIRVDIAQAGGEKKEGMEQQEEKVTKNKGQRKQQKGKAGKQGKWIKGRRASQEQKVDYPELLIKAHQSAYAYLNPSISRYKALMGLFDQAVQIQIQLQQMVRFLALRYEEVNQALEGIASDGEKLMKESGEHLAWPLGKGVALRTEPPPDLLQQLLQYSIQKMQLMGGAVGGVTDSALKEAVDYFGAASDLMAKKLKVKRGLDGRLARVLGRIEEAAVRKPGPVDMTLHSEDSGIGGESESMASSERHQQCRKSCGSASVGVTKPYNCLPEKNKASASPPPPAMSDSCTFIRQVPKWSENPENEEMSLKMKDAISGRIRFVPGKYNGNCSNGSVGSSTTQWPEEEEHKGKRPQTAAAITRGSKKGAAAKQRRSRSAESLRSQGEDPTLLELHRTQKDLSRRLEKMSEGKTADGRSANPKLGGNQPLANASSNNRLHSSLDSSILPSQDRPVLWKSGSGEQGMEEEKKKKEKSGGRATPPSTPPPKNERKSVKRLIDTFSQIKENVNNTSLLMPLAPPRGVWKCGVPILPSMGYWGLASINSKGDVWDLGDIDLDNLPPPPPEVLMDDSFQITDRPLAPNDTSIPSTDSNGTRGRSPYPQRTSVSQRLKASLNSIHVLPSKGSFQRALVSVSPQRSGRQDAGSRNSSVESQPEIRPDPEKEEAASLYRQARKIIHLRHSTESLSGSSIEKVQTRMDFNISTRKACLIHGATEAFPSPPSLPQIPPPALQLLQEQPHQLAHPFMALASCPQPTQHRRQPSLTSASPPTTQKQPNLSKQGSFPAPLPFRGDLIQPARAAPRGKSPAHLHSAKQHPVPFPLELPTTATPTPGTARIQEMSSLPLLITLVMSNPSSVLALAPSLRPPPHPAEVFCPIPEESRLQATGPR
ncbi:PCARE regulator, partial [Polyodon spathula]|nr:PCARE regulator [Polyodon spathula]